MNPETAMRQIGAAMRELKEESERLRTENERLRAAVRLAADTFRDYSDMLWDGTPEGNRRAIELNRREIQMREALNNQPKET